MSITVVTPGQATDKPAFDFAKFQADRAAGKITEAAKGGDPASTAVVDPAAEPVKRASGDERKFRRLLSKRDQEIGELRAKVDQLTPKQAAGAAKTVDTNAAPKREDFASDELFDDARIAHAAQAATKKALDERASEEGLTKEVRDLTASYNERMERGPQKYDDWADVIAGAKGAALNVDLSKECPGLFGAILKSPYNDDCFYHWLKDSSKLQVLIDQYKTDPSAAIAAFHRFEGRVGKDEIPAKTEADKSKQADDAAGARKPKPSAETTVRAGKSAPDGPPPVMLTGGVMNPAWKAYRAQQERR